MKIRLPNPFRSAPLSSGQVGGFEAKKPSQSGGSAQIALPDDAPWLRPTPPGSQVEPLLELPPLSRSAPSLDRFAEPQGVLQGLWRTAVELVRGSSASREVNRAKKTVSEVNALAEEMKALSDDELKAQTPHFKSVISEGTSVEREALAKAEAKAKAAPESLRGEALAEVEKARTTLYKAEQKILDKILPEAFATVREAARRATGMYHYDVQVMGGALMHRGMIAEMYTGEGKTLAATLPAYLNALAGHGFHVATVNDYLAKRDAEEMGAIYGFLGLSVGILQGNLQQLVIEPGGKPEPVDRKAAYDADITYATASELGFDYLRDNQVRDAEQRVQRPLYGALLDEVDSLLVDEARIPLILAKKGLDPDVEKLKKYDQLARRLHQEVVASLEGQPKKDALFDDKDIEWEEHWVSLTDSGMAKMIDQLGFSPWESEGIEELSYLQDALRAWFNLSESGQYAVIDGKISTVGLGGHPGPGRRFTGGLHQALETKHGLEVLPENMTSASVTMREYLSLYAKRSGMTGTAMSARELFLEVYGLDVARVPTRKPLIRVDYPDKSFETQDAKTKQFLDDVQKVHQTGRPILVGVEYTHTAEWLGEELKKLGLPVEVLGAKSDGEEARIIANAGKKGAITVATTRGGRGVDIKLGGNAKVMAEALIAAGADPIDARAQAGAAAAKERADVLATGGLMVMAFEHLDSRRRDDQLRGRAGRQGEPGATLFYSSLEDPLFDDARASAEKNKTTLAFDPKKQPYLTESALDTSENKVNGALSQTLPFDKILAEHRDRFYRSRRNVLESTDVRPLVEQLVAQSIDDIIERTLPGAKVIGSDEQARALYTALSAILPLPAGEPPGQWTGSKIEDVRAQLDKLGAALIAKRDSSVGEELSRLLEKDVVLSTLDDLWGEFLESMLVLRDGIHWRAYAQKDPKQEFFREAGELYVHLMQTISADVSARVLKHVPKLPSLDEPAPQAAPAAKA